MGKRLAGLLATLAASAAIVWAIGLLPALENQGFGPRDGIAVFLNDKPAVLDDATLPDWLAALPRTMELKRAEWDGRLLLLDFRADGKTLGGDRLYGAVSDVVIAALLGTENVARLRIRVYDPYGAPGRDRRLILALDAGRDAFAAGAHEAWLKRDLPPGEWLARYFWLTGEPR